MVLRPSGSSVHPPVQPKSLGDSATLWTVVGIPSIIALQLSLKGELDLGEDSFTWPHPTHSGEVLFVLDDAAG